MNEAALYRRINGQTRRDAKIILEQYAGLMQWCKNGGDTLIDIGTGSGDVLMDLIHPLVPPNFKEIVGSDISDNMLRYALKNYAECERVKFEILDVGAEEVPKQMLGRFDHVTSFYCLHWIQNLSKALENIHQILRSTGGDCLLVFLAKSIVYDVYKVMVKIQKWSKVMQDYQQFISPLHHSDDPAAEFAQKLQRAGFVDCHVEVRNDFYMYDTQMFRGIIRAVVPFFERIPTVLHEAFIDDFIDIVVSMNLREPIKNSNDYEYKSKYSLVIAYARKSEGVSNKIGMQFE